MATILVVCEANICRSPMAQGVLAARLPGARVLSAGLRAWAGKPADPAAVDILAGRGIDIRGHVAVPLNLQFMREADLVLTMTLAQQRSVEGAYPFAKGKVFRVGERDGQDVVDPYRQDRAAFQASLTQIEQGLMHWLEAILRINR